MKLPKIFAERSRQTTGLSPTREILLDGIDPPEVMAARAQMRNGDLAAAFAALNRVKSGRGPARNADYLRAHYFLAAGQTGAAIQALREELRWFTDHKAAADLLRELETSDSKTASLGTPEFQNLFSSIRPYTMVGEARLWSLFQLATAVCAEDLPGNFAECGVAAGGSSALLATVIAKKSQRPRWLYCFDTFTGMPPATDADQHEGVAAENSGWGTGTCSAPENSLRQIARALNVEHVLRPVAGLFADTLPRQRAAVGPIALLHLDGDWHDSTMDILHNLFDNVVPGGRLQIDDYGYWQGCRLALDEFAQQRGLKLQLHRIDETGVWMRK